MQCFHSVNAKTSSRCLSNLMVWGMRILFLACILTVFSINDSGCSDVPIERLSENLVNTNLDGNQKFPDIAADKSTGTLLIAWHDATNGKVSYRLYNKLGNYLSDVMIVETSSVTGDVPNLATDELSNEDYFVVWIETGNLCGRYIEGDGSILGGEDDFLISEMGKMCVTPEISIIPASARQGYVNDVAMVVWNQIREGANPFDDDNVFGRLFPLIWGEAPTGFITEPRHLDPSSIGGAYEEDAQVEIDGIKLDDPSTGYFASSWIFNKESEDSSSLRYNGYDDNGEEEFDELHEFDIQSYDPDLHESPAVTIDKDYRVTIAWADNENQTPTIRAQQFDFSGNVTIDEFQVNSMPLSDPTRGIESVKIKSFENNDFIVVWEAYAYFDDSHVAIFGRRYDQDGNPLDSEELILSDVVEFENNARKPSLDTHKDKFIVAWQDDRLVNGQDKGLNVINSIWTCDIHDPILYEVPEKENHAYLYDLVEYEGGVPIGPATSHDSNASRIPSGIDSLMIYSTSYAFDGCEFEDASQMNPEGNEYNGLVRRCRVNEDLIVAGTKIEYRITSYDGVGRIAQDPPGDIYTVWVTNKGDVNVDGMVTQTDVDLACDIWEGHNDKDYQFYFADVNDDSYVTYDDIEAIKDLIGTQWYTQKRYDCNVEIIAIPDQIGIDIGSGQPGSIGIEVPVYLENDSTPVSSITYVVEYDSTVLDLSSKMTTPRSAAFTINDNLCIDDHHEYVSLRSYEDILNTEFGDSAEVVYLYFDVVPDASKGSYHITLTEGDICDTLLRKTPDHHYRGKFFVGEAPAVSIVCTPVSDTSLIRGDTLTFHTRLTNHHWEGVTASVFMYGTVTPQGMNPFLVVDTTYVYLPPGEKVTTLTELEAPQNAPLVHYEFTGYVCEVDTTYDTDTFGFHVSDTLGMMGGGGLQLTGAEANWELISGWFESRGGRNQLGDSPGSSSIPKIYALSQNFPNPFNPSTEIIFAIPAHKIDGVKTTISIYNVRGQLLKKFDEGLKVPGYYRIIWDGRDDDGMKVASGIYFYQLSAGEYSTTRKMVMMK